MGIIDNVNYDCIMFQSHQFKAPAVVHVASLDFFCYEEIPDIYLLIKVVDRDFQCDFMYQYSCQINVRQFILNALHSCTVLSIDFKGEICKITFHKMN